MRKWFRTLSAAVGIAGLVLALTGCGKLTVDDIMAVVAPTEAPTPDANFLFPSQMEETVEVEPLALTCQELGGILSPFWAETDGDRQVAELTQLSLLAHEGSQSPSEISRSGNEDGSVTVTIRLRDGIFFADGAELTADDLIFTYYVLLDGDYDGPYQLRTLPVRGLSTYWNGMDSDMYAKYITIFDETYNGGRYELDLQEALQQAQDAARENGVSEDNLPYDTNVKKAQEALDEYDTQRAEEIRSAIIQAWKQDAQAIVDYCLANYSTSIEMKTGYTRDEVLQDAGLQVMFAMVDTGYGTLETDGTLTGTVTGAVWDMKNQFPTVEEFYEEMSAAYEGDAERYWSVEGYDRPNMLENAQNALIRSWAALDPDWKGAVNNIEGIRKEDSRTVTVTLEYCDEATLETLCDIYVAPLHVYGDPAQYDYAADSFGFPKGDLSEVRAKNGVSMGAGEYIYQETELRTVILTANPNYWLGEPEAPSAEIREA